MIAERPPAIDLDGLLRRLHLPTVRRLYPDLAERAEAEDMTYRDFLAVLMAEETAHRAQTRIQRCVRRARFPFLKTIDEYDFTFQSAVRLSLLGSALGPEFITQGHSLVVSGPSGTGKTHLAVAIAYRAIQNGFDAYFTTATALIDEALRRLSARQASPHSPDVHPPGGPRHRRSGLSELRARCGQRPLSGRQRQLPASAPDDLHDQQAPRRLGPRAARSGSR
jgi:hypothetical protein